MNYTSKNIENPPDLNWYKRSSLPVRNFFVSFLSFFLLSFFANGVSAQYINNHKKDAVVPKNTVAPKSVEVASNNAAAKTLATFTSSVSGLWSDPATWGGVSIPGAGDDVTIADGTTVTIDINTASLNSLTVGQGASGILQYDATSPFSVTVSGNVIVSPGAIFRSATSGTVASHSLNISGDLTNNGTLNFNAVAGAAGTGALITFTGATDANFVCSNTSVSNLFSPAGITLNKGSSYSTLLNFTPGGTFQVLSANTKGFLTISKGTFKIIGTNSFSNPVFDATGYTIPSTGGIWLNNSLATIVGQGNSSLLSGGLIRITNGTYNIGTGSGNTLTYSNAGTITIEGGNFNVAGRISPSTSGVSLINYSQSGGIVTVVTQASGSTSLAGFDISATGSSFTMSGGSIVLQNTTSNSVDFLNLAGTSSVTGGLIQMGNASTPPSQTFKIKSTPEIYDLRIHNVQSPSVSLLGNITVNHLLTFFSYFNLYGFNLTMGASASPIAPVGTFSNSRMIVSNNGMAGGEVRKIFSGSGSYVFPIGDINYFSPVTLDITSAAAYGGYAGVKVENIKHPNNFNTNNFTNRYWRVSTSGITDPTYNVTATYSNPPDLTGTSGNMVMGKFVSKPWVKYSAATSSQLTANGVSVSGSTSSIDFSGISAIPPTVVVNDTAFCAGVTGHLTAYATGDPTVTFLWSPGGETTPVINITNGGTYSVIITDGNGFTAPDAGDVTVNPLPTIFNVTGGGSYCAGGTGVAVGLSGSEAGVNYQLKRGVTDVGSPVAGTGAAINFGNQTTAGTYTVVATNATTNCTVTMSGNAVVSIDPLPTITPGVNPTVCSGSTTANLTYSATTGSPNHYNISFDGTAQGAGFIDVVNANLPLSPIVITVPSGAPGATYNATLTVTNSTTGCVSNSTAITITVTAFPTITLGSNPSVCVGTTSANLTYSATTGTPNQYSVDWDAAANLAGISDVNITGLPLSPISLTIPGAVAAGVYNGTLTVYNSGTGCASNGYPITVTVNARPVPTISGPAGACVGSTGNIYTTETGMSGYTWALTGGGGTITAGSGTNSITVTWGTAGAKTVTVNYTDANGCNATSSTIYNVTVNANPTATITGTPSLCAGASTILSAASSVAGSGTITGYQWNLAGSPMAGETNQTLTVTAAGSYTVTVINSNNCSTTSTATIVSVNALPTITLGTNPSVCSGTISANLTYSATTGTPNQYSIDFDAAANLAGIADVNNATLPVSPISITIPGAVAAGTYNGTLTVKNTTTGCVSNGTAIAVTVNARPVPTVSGPANACIGSTGNVYTTEAGMSGYSWTVSAGGTITAGTGTNSITVTWATAGAKTVTVNYIDANGCNATSATIYNVTVNANPTATITGTPSLCAGASTILSATSSTAGSGTISGYQWNLAGSPIGGATSSTYTATAAGSYTVTITNSNNCSTTSAATNVTVNATPAITVGTNPSICRGTITANLPFSGATGTPNQYSVDWDGAANLAGIGDVSNVAFAGSPIALAIPGAVAAGVYNGTLTVRNSGTGCVSNGYPITVTVNARPVPTISGPAGACAGSTGNVYTTESGMSGYTWALTGGGGTITAGAGTNSITVSWTTATAKTVTVNYTDANGCNAASATVYNVTVNANPTATITGTASFCAGGSTVLSAATSTPGSGTISGYQWRLAGTPIPGETNQTLTVTAAGSYTVTVTNTNNCSTTSTATNVTVNALPSITVGTNPSICRGATTANLPFSGATGTPNQYSVDWDGAANLAGIGDVTNVAFGASPISLVIPGAVAAGVYNGTLTVRNSGTGCVSNSYPITVTVNARPVPTISGPAGACANSTGNIYTTEAGMSGYTWALTGGGGTITAGTGTNTITVSWTTTGAKTVTVNYTDGNGCNATSATVYNVTVNANPTATITGTASFCAGGNTVLSAATSTPGSGSITGYQWNLAGTPIAGETNSTLTVSVAGNYTVTVINSNSCSNTSAITNVVVTPAPTATFSYTATPYCKNASNPSPTFSGGGVAGTFTSTTGLVFVSAATGQIDLAASATGTYTVTNTIAAANGCPQVIATSDVTINPIGSITLTSAPATTSQTVCASTAITDITYAINGTSTGATVSGLPAGLTGTFNAGVFTISGTPTASGTYTVTATGSPCNSPTATGTITLNNVTSGTISANQNICSGGNPAAFTHTAATGSGTISYQWQSSITDCSTGFTNLGVTTTTYNPPALTVTTYYRRVATSLLNGVSCTANSNCVTVVVNPNPVLSITNPTAVCSPNTVDITAASVTAGSTLLSGTLSYYTNAAATIVLANPNAVASSGTYYIKVTTSNGCVDVKPVTVTINTLPTTYTLSTVGSNSYCQGGSGVIIRLSDSQTGVSYQLQKDGVNVGTPVAGTNLPFNFPAQTAAGVYTVIATNTTTTCQANMSGSITVIINPLPTISVSSTNPTFCVGGSTSLTASGASTYTWSPSTGLSATTGATVTASPSATTTYTATGTDINGCVNTTTVTVTVNQVPGMLYMQESFNYMNSGTLGTQNGWVPFQDGASAIDIKVGNSAPLTYSGYGSACTYDSVDGGLDPYKPFSLPISTSSNTSIWTSFLVNVKDAAHWSANTTPSVVLKNTANPAAYLSCLSIGTNNADVYFGISRGGDNIAWSFVPKVKSQTYLIVLRYDIVPAGTDVMYMWVNPSLASQPNTGSADATVSIGTVANYGSQVNALQQMQGTGAGTPPEAKFDDFKVSKNWQNLVDQYDTIYCNGAPGSSIIFHSDAPGTTYSWTGTANVGFGTSGSGNISSYTATNAGSSIIIDTITVIPTANGCPGTPTKYYITVLPTITVTAPADQTVCKGTSTAAVNFTGNGTTYTWTNSNTAIGLAASGTGNIPSFVATNNTSLPISGTITVTPVYTSTCKTCTGLAPVTFTITVNPTPTATISATSPICVGDPTFLTISSTGVGPWNVTYSDGTTLFPQTGLPQNIIFQATPITNTTYTLSALSDQNCPGTVGPPAVVVVNPLPTITGTLNVCVGNSSQLTGSGTAAASNPWVSSNSAVATVSPSGLVTTLSIGTTTITYTNSNGCKQTALITVSAKPTPIIYHN